MLFFFSTPYYCLSVTHTQFSAIWLVLGGIFSSIRTTVWYGGVEERTRWCCVPDRTILFIVMPSLPCLSPHYYSTCNDGSKAVCYNEKPPFPVSV